MVISCLPYLPQLFIMNSIISTFVTCRLSCIQSLTCFKASFTVWMLSRPNCVKVNYKHLHPFFHLFFVLPAQGGDSDDDAEGFASTEDAQPSCDSPPAPSQDLEGISTYGEEDLVPEPHRVSKADCIQSIESGFPVLYSVMMFL